MLKFLKRLFSGKRRWLKSPQTSWLPAGDFSTTSSLHVRDACHTISSSHGGHHVSSHSVDCSSDGGGHVS
jgi:hypothetical protein